MTTIMIAILVTSSPIALASLGAVLSYRAGLLDIGLEGKIAVGTVFALAWTPLIPQSSQYPWAWGLAILIAVIGATVMSLLHAFVVLYGKADAFISGIGINLAGLAIVSIGLQVAFGSPGSSSGSSRILVPPLSPVLAPLTLIDLLAVIGACLLAYLLAFTRSGAWVHALGTAPEAIVRAGINPKPVAMIAFIGSGIAAGLAASQLTIGSLGIVSPTMVAGRGFLALAAAVVARGRVWPTMGCCLIVGTGEAMADYLVTQTKAPQLLLALPWLFALIGIMFSAIIRKNANTSAQIE